VFCPLSYARTLLGHGSVYEEDECRREYDASWLQHCDDMIVQVPPEWAESRGVLMQIEAAALC